MARAVVPARPAARDRPDRGGQPRVRPGRGAGPGAGAFRAAFRGGRGVRFPDGTCGGGWWAWDSRRRAPARSCGRNPARAGCPSRTRSTRTTRFCAARCCRGCWRWPGATRARERRTCGCSRSDGCSLPGWPVGQAEPRHVCLVLTGAALPSAWRHGSGGSRALDLHDLRGVVEALCAPAAVELRPADAPDQRREPRRCWRR